MTAQLPVSPTPAADLLRQSQAELDSLFALLPTPAETTLDGHWRGTLFAILGLGWLPRALASGVYRALALPVNPWRGKHFEQGHGANRWFRLPGAAFAEYRVQRRTSPVDGRAVIWLDYDVAGNPAFLRGIRGEARALGEHLLLCRMNWQGAAGLHRVLYFTLERQP